MTEEIAVQSKSAKSVHDGTLEGKTFRDLSGRKYGPITVIEFAGRSSTGRKRLLWKTLCRCGISRDLRKIDFDSVFSFECGCVRSIPVDNPKPSSELRESPEFNAWSSMKKRCLNSRHKRWSDYGGRGITVCDRWIMSFYNFLADMGERPSAFHSLDRIDNNGNYDPSNCRWATRQQQNGNTRYNHFVSYNGQTLCVAALERELGMPITSLKQRLARGWSIDDAVTVPVRVSKRLKPPSRKPCTDQSASLHHQACHA